jgi:geranylgeranyl transferase type-2 subunit beta
LLYTLSAVQILVQHDSLIGSLAGSLDDGAAAGGAAAVGPVRVNALAEFVAGLQRPDGSFAGDEFSDDDTRYSYCALSCLALVDGLDRVNLKSAAAHIMRCAAPEGGFGIRTGTEAHAGQTFCSLAALALCGRLPTGEHRDRIVEWLAARELPHATGGGVNGRPDKREDGCYAWWVSASLTILDADAEAKIDKALLIEFVESLQTEKGGLSPKRGDAADVYHTHFGVAALAVLGHPATVPVDPIHCLPADTVVKLHARMMSHRDGVGCSRPPDGNEDEVPTKP